MENLPQKNDEKVKTAQFFKEMEKHGIVTTEQQQSALDMLKIFKDAYLNGNELLIEIISNSLDGFPHKNDAHAKNVIARVIEQSPQEDLHALRLNLQANNLYFQGMHFLNKANNGGSEFHMNSAIKLLRLHNETIETLNRYLRKGEQKVVVQHVNINGGQAIVGHIETGGGKKSNEVPHG